MEVGAAPGRWGAERQRGSVPESGLTLEILQICPPHGQIDRHPISEVCSQKQEGAVAGNTRGAGTATSSDDFA